MGLSGPEVGIDKTNLDAHALAEMPNTPRLTPNATRLIEVLVYPSVQLLDVTGPVQVFASANDMALKRGKMPPYAVRIVSQGGQRVTASAGLELAADSLPPIGATLDTLVVAGGQGVEAAASDAVLVDW
jgi:transcriptional regulator GlxA family with amidase domain